MRGDWREGTEGFTEEGGTDLDLMLGLEFSSRRKRKWH